MEYITYSIMNSGIPEEISFSRTTMEEILIPLLQKLADLRAEKGRRILVMLAAPPGAGKTTLVHFLAKMVEERDNLPKLTILGMDGFHRYQDYLLSHTMERNGESIPMVKVKGAPETFDLPLLAERVRCVAAGEPCGWPEYDRLLHNPVEDAQQVTGEVILLEGNYLLLDWDGWRDLRQFADYTIRIIADEEILRGRLLRRKMSTGVGEAEAAAFVDYSDMYNVRTCLQESREANLVLEVVGNGILARKV